VPSQFRRAGAVELVPQCLAEAPHGCLRRAVDRAARKAPQPGPRGHEHDVPAAALEHPGEHGLDEVDRAEPVQAGHLLDDLDVHVVERRVVGATGVGHRHVDDAEVLDGRGHRLAVARVGGERLVSLPGKLRDDLVQAVLVAGEEAKRASTPRERRGGHLPDAPRRSGHEHTCSRTEVHARDRIARYGE